MQEQQKSTKIKRTYGTWEAGEVGYEGRFITLQANIVVGVVKRLVESDHDVVDQLAALRLVRRIAVRTVRPQQPCPVAVDAAEGAGGDEQAVRFDEGRRLVGENLTGQYGRTLIFVEVYSLPQGLEVCEIARF